MTWQTLICNLRFLLLLTLTVLLSYSSHAQFSKANISGRKFPDANKIFMGNLSPIPNITVKQKAALRTNQSQANTCNTSTFYLKIPAPAGEKIELRKLQTFADGNYLAAGNATLANGQNVGLLMILGNDGVIIRQQKFQINNQPVIINDAVVSVSGNILITGFFSDGSKSMFIACLRPDFSNVWIKNISLTSVPQKISLALIDINDIMIAAQLTGAITYCFFDVNGVQRWSRNLVAGNMSELTGINSLNYGTLGIVSNCINNGRQLVQVFEIDKITGNLLQTSYEGDGITESRSMAVTYFNNRLNILGVTKDGAGLFNGFRNNIYSAPISETVHRFTSPAALDFSVNAGMDNAGDALAYFIPASQELIFIKHFSYYTTSAEFSKSYIINNGASVNGVTRSFDGGFLFAVNSKLSNEITLIKTDSSGILAGCGEQSLSISSTETMNVPNTVTTAISNSSINFVSDNLLQGQTASYNQVFSCKQNFCPQEPLTDSCLSSYYKTFRSGSYAEFIYNYFLLKNNKQLLLTTRYDRITGNINQLTYGLKLLDEKGGLLQAVDLYNGTASQPISMFKMDDNQVMLVAYSPVNGSQRFNFTLVDDNLVKKWDKSIITGTDFYSEGIGVSDIHKDQEGNFYAIATSEGFSTSKPAIYIYKMDPAGNPLWTKAYETTNGLFGTASITTTNNSVVIVIESRSPGSISMQLNKSDGQLLNSYRLPVTFDGLVYTRMLKYEAGKIIYAGSDLQERYLMGLFDTTGRPLRFRYANAEGSVMRSSVFRDGNLYSTYQYWDGSAYREVLLKADTGLDIRFINQYNTDRSRLSKGLSVSDAGNIYSGGNFSYGGTNGQYSDPFIIKYGLMGEMGECPFIPLSTAFIDIPPATSNVSWSSMNRSYPNSNFSLLMLNSTSLLNINNILCSNVSQCSFIKLVDPGPLCRLNNDYIIHYRKDLNCNLKPQWLYDTSFATLKQVTDTTVLFNFRKVGSSWIRAGLNTGCKLYLDSIQVKIQSAPASLSIGPDKILCAGDSVLLHAGPGFETYKWMNGSTDSNLIVKQPGVCFVQVTNACAETSADTVLIRSAIVPLLNLGPDMSACIYDSIMLTANAGFASYKWQPSTLVNGSDRIVKIAAPADTTVYVEAKTNDGCIARDTIGIQILKARSVTLGADTSFCASDSIFLNAGNGYLEYRWSTGNTEQVIKVNEPGPYQVAAKDSNGCYARDTLLVLETFSKPEILLGPDRNICEGTTLTLDPGNFAGYQWSDGSSTRLLNVVSAGAYRVTVTDSHHCKASDSIVIKNIVPLPAAFLKANDTICNYGKLLIFPEKKYNTYQWSDGSFTSALTITKAGTYSLTVTDINGCKGSDTILIIGKDCLSGLFLPNAFSPNGDNRNDRFKAIVYGPLSHFSLQVYNRFGQMVYYNTDSDAGWDGYYKGKACDAGAYIWQCRYQFVRGQPMYEKGHVLLIR